MSAPKCPFHQFPDPFATARKDKDYREIDDQGDPVRMVLGYDDVKRYALDWEAFSSAAEPGRIVVPSEVPIRDIRQIPFETDPGEHTDYRALLEDWFRRPLGKNYEAALTEMVVAELDRAMAAPRTEVVHDFALPLQSRALTLLLNCPPAEAEHWIGWGTHVFRSDDNPLDGSKANELYDYLDEQINRAAAAPETGDDLYAELVRAEYRGRRLTHEEIKGIMVLTFAGGRDTVINAVTNTIAYFAGHPEELAALKGNKRGIVRAVEELVRYFAPLTHIGRVATGPVAVGAHTVAPGERISLCWAAANRDPAVFERPDEVVLDRRANPHLGFGIGTHNCLGASHARQVLRVLVREMADRVGTITVLEEDVNEEEWGDFRRKVGFETLVVTMR